MRAGGYICCGLGAVLLAASALSPAIAQTWAGPAQTVPGAWRADTTSFEFSDSAHLDVAPGGFGGAFRLADHDFTPGRGEVVTEAWRDTPSGAVERLRLTRGGDWLRADGAAIPLTPRDAAVLAGDEYSLSYTRGWPSRSYDPDSGLQVEVIPHAGFGVGSEGGTAEAGATIRIGSGLNRLVPDGDTAFDEDQGRWYVFAAGSRRAVGYNFARTREGDFVSSGMSHDSGSFIGDAQVGVAWRRGDLQTSFGYVYRKHKVRELVGRDFERERSEGVLAFQVSIRPDW
ncbi:MAG: lipid A-modifier LpxR family protein [Brevundimonas sp.]|uniref:lipid A-modifier LpxR family protein n=1 Tax=Brevundimonas sp. TaxID=1871086 RepID=UPI003919A2A4